MSNAGYSVCCSYSVYFTYVVCFTKMRAEWTHWAMPAADACPPITIRNDLSCFALWHSMTLQCSRIARVAMVTHGVIFSPVANLRVALNFYRL